MYKFLDRQRYLLTDDTAIKDALKQLYPNQAVLVRPGRVYRIRIALGDCGKVDAICREIEAKR